MQVPYLSKETIEIAMETQIEESGLWPDSEFDVFNIEEFLTSHLEVDLDMFYDLPPEIMGEAVFTNGKQTLVHINRDLTYSAENKSATWNAARWQIGRCRMTVAHESAHVILHEPVIFPRASDGTPLLADPSKTYRCHKKNISDMGVAPTKNESFNEFGKHSAWKKAAFNEEDEQTLIMERQANYAASALLMPRSRFIKAASELRAFINEGYPHHPEKARQQRVHQELADRFRVSQQAARLRCEAVA